MLLELSKSGVSPQRHQCYYHRLVYRRYLELPDPEFEAVPLFIQRFRLPGHGRLVRPGLCPEEFPQGLGPGSHGQARI